MELIRNIYHIIKNNSRLNTICSTIYNFLNSNKIKKRKNIVKYKGSYLKKCKIVINGKNNKIIISESCILIKTDIFIHGNNNTVFIDNNCYINNGEFWIEDNGNTINIGLGTKICGKTHLACIEGTKISVGKNCLFSTNIIFRTGDSHSIIDMVGNRINPSKDIIIGDKVWFNYSTIINKGVNIAHDTIIGSGAVVTKDFKDYPHVILAGVPAKIIKENISWKGERI